MPLSRVEVTAGLPAELSGMAELVRSLSDEEWAKPTRCAGWTVADVAAHIAGTMTDIANGQIEGQGTPEVTERQVVERRGRSRDELATELEGAAKVSADLLAVFDDAAWDGPAPGGFDGTLGWGVEALWYDAYMHIQDIRTAVGLPEVAAPALKAAVSHVAGLLTRREWGPATLALDGMPKFDVGAGGKEIRGDPLAFVMAATGRGDPSQFGLGPDVNIYAG
jgi:uncharacterized protein (TIGR03083 family)